MRTSRKKLKTRGANGARRKKSTPNGWIYGHHAVVAALRNPNRIIRQLLATTNAAEKLQDCAGETAITITNREEIELHTEPGAVHQGVAADVEPLPRAEIEDVIAAAKDKKQVTVLALDQATDPRNVGAVLRSAAAFGVAALIQQDRHAPPITGAMTKAASGGLEHVTMLNVTNFARALNQLKDADFWIVGLDGAADHELGKLDMPDKCCLVLGAESSGLRRLTREACDLAVKIPINEDIGSLNLSNAAAVALYEINRRRRG
jgi:23S rRNA (guanosine2251-2'-O)-methyltransferase